MKKLKKMFYNILIVPILSIMTFFHCSTPKVLPENYDGQKIEFGSGGGFTGGVTTHTLLDNGDLYLQKPMSDTLNYLQRIEKNVATQIFSNYQTLKINELNINNPGNIYKFVTFYDGESVHKLVWSGKSEFNQLTLFYDNLKAITELNLEQK